MRYLLFNIVVAGALVVLATGDENSSEDISSKIETVKTSVMQVVNAEPQPVVPETVSPEIVEPIKMPEKAVVEETPKTPTIKSIEAEPIFVPTREAKNPPSPEFIENEINVEPSIQVVEDQSMMSDRDRRRELLALAQSMEMVFYNKVTQ